MLALRLFAGLALDNPDRIALGRAAQRRRLALLAVLASPAGSAVPREKLLGLLWPEVPADDARHRLSVALYDLRQALGDDGIAFNTHTITLNPAAITVDVATFEAAMAREDWEGAVAAYTGPFLEGVYLVDAPEFEQWVDARRSALERMFARALEAVAHERTRRGDYDGAVEAWRGLTRIDPYSERYAAGLMRALESAGNRGGALRHAAAHAELLRAELDADPAADVAHLAAELKRTALAAPVPPAAAATPQTHDAGSPERPIEHPVTVKRQQKPRRWIGAVVLVAGLLLLTAALRMLPSGTMFRMAPSDAAATAGKSASALRALRDGERHMLSGRFAAGLAAFESAVNQDSTLAIAHLQVAIATLWADQPGADVPARVARALAHRDDLDELNRVLLDGFAAWTRGDWHQAEALSRRALTLDPASIAARHQLGETLFHYNAPQGRPVSEARAEFEAVIAREPHHYGALWHLAQLAAHDGRADDVDKLTSRLLAVRPDAVRRLEVEALRTAGLGDSAGFNHLLSRLRDADKFLVFGIGWRMAIFGRDLDGAERVFALLTDAHRDPYARGLGHTQLLYLDIARGRTTISTRLKSLHELRDPGVPVVWPTLLAAIAPGSPIDTSTLRFLRDSLAVVVAGRLKTDLSIRDVEDASALGWTLALLGDSTRAVAVAARLEESARTLDRETPTLAAYATGRAASIRAMLAKQYGNAHEVVRWVDRSLTTRWFGHGLTSPDRAYSLERYLRAEALLMLGRAHEADAWLATIGAHDPSDLVFLVPALLRRAGIANSRGDPAAARVFRKQVDALRRTPSD